MCGSARSWPVSWTPSGHHSQALALIPVDTRTSDGRRVVGEWVYGAGVPRDRADTAIYFVHGSGYVLCSPRTHRRLTSWLSRLTGLPVFSVGLRLAPRHRFPRAADDVRSGWDWLTHDLGLAPEASRRRRLRRRASVRRPASATRRRPPVRAGVALPRGGPDLTLARTRERLRQTRLSAPATQSDLSSCTVRESIPVIPD